MMMKAFFAAAGIALLSGAAFADTPIGPGVTGAGGTGATAADSKLRAGAGGEAPVLRQDGMPAERADANAKAAGKRSEEAAGRGATNLPPAEASMGRNFLGQEAAGKTVRDKAEGAALPPADASMGK
jgi:hypothetical protein